MSVMHTIKQAASYDAWKYKMLRAFNKRVPLSVLISRKVLGHEGGMDVYILGKVQHSLIQLLSKKASSAHQPDARSIEMLRKNHFAPIELDVTEEKITIIREKMNVIMEDGSLVRPRGKKVNGQNYSWIILNVVQHIPEIKEIITPKLDSFLKEYYGSNYGITSIRCWRNHHIPLSKESMKVYSNEWHNDYMKPTELKFFVNITNVGKDDGPFHVIDKNTTSQLMKLKTFTGRHKNYDVEAIDSLDAVKRHIGNAGAAVFCHTSTCLHRADIPAEGHYRDMLQFQFHPSVASLPENWENPKYKYN